MNKLIEFESVTKTYIHKFSKHKVVALDNVSFSVRKGDVCALIGESGAGKTTIAKLLTGVEKPDSGKIYYNGNNILMQNTNELKKTARKIHYLHQDPYSAFNPVKLIVQSVGEPMLVIGDFSKSEIKKKMEQVFKMLNLDINLLSNKKPFQVSGGELQRLAIARALMLEPEVIVLDEPFASVDSENKEQILGILLSLQKKGITVILISHNLQMVKKVADNVFTLKQGKFVEKELAEEIKN